MVLTGRSIARVAALAALAAILLAGCSESLFGAHHAGPGDGGGDGSDALPPGSCTAPCIADAAAEFDGSPGGIGGHWRYLDDERSPQRSWSVMTASAGEMIGLGSNRITRCAVHPDRAACTVLPGALLVTSTGATSAADPAIEFKAPTGQVIELRLRAFVPAGDDQTIRLYRNSREDVLFTEVATAGTSVAHELTVDALPGDRFLVAVAPTGNGTADVGLQLFASAAPRAFPASCQLALRFDDLTAGNSVSDLLCARVALTHLRTTGTSTPLELAPAPFLELGNSGIIEGGTYLHEFQGARVLDYTQDVTVQLWVNLMSYVNADRASVFSDLDTTGGGIEISVLAGPPEMIAVTTRTTASTLVEVTGPQPLIGAWHFVRVVRGAAGLRVCVDGAPEASTDLPPLLSLATHLPDLGKDLQVASDMASFDGDLDDVRVITGALPCE